MLISLNTTFLQHFKRFSWCVDDGKNIRPSLIPAVPSDWCFYWLFGLDCFVKFDIAVKLLRSCGCFWQFVYGEKCRKSLLVWILYWKFFSWVSTKCMYRNYLRNIDTNKIPKFILVSHGELTANLKPKHGVFSLWNTQSFYLSHVMEQTQIFEV